MVRRPATTMCTLSAHLRDARHAGPEELLQQGQDGGRVEDGVPGGCQHGRHGGLLHVRRGPLHHLQAE